MDRKGLGSRRLLIGVLVAGAVAAAAFLATSYSSLYEVKEEGRNLLPYESGEVYKVEVLGGVTLYADGESRPRRA